MFQQRPSVDAWVSLLRSSSALTRTFNAQLVADHGLTINDYEVLLILARAPDRRLRRVDLAGHLLLTASGITRLLDGLERDGYVTKAQCKTDARVTYAVLTEAGRNKLARASGSHVSQVADLFRERFSDEELATLAELLGRLPGAAGDAEDCAAGPA